MVEEQKIKGGKMIMTFIKEGSKVIHSEKYEGSAVVYDGDRFDYFLINGEKETLQEMVTDIKRQIDAGKYKHARELIRYINPLVQQHKDDNLREYFDLVEHYLLQERAANKKDEYYYQKLFNDKCEIILDGVKLIKKKSIYGHYPDAWVKIGVEEIPVEVKLNDFDKKALKQLERYINVYNKKKGIAVGRKLSVELPHNIAFVSLDELEQNN